MRARAAARRAFLRRLRGSDTGVGDQGSKTTRTEHPKPAPWHLKPDPRSYTPKHLADKILTSRAALEGERKPVTVLFADVKGSMELAEQRDPEEWHAILATRTRSARHPATTTACRPG
jgi:hypothetical protein